MPAYLQIYMIVKVMVSSYIINKLNMLTSLVCTLNFARLHQHFRRLEGKILLSSLLKSGCNLWEKKRRYKNVEKR